jgi:CheY-like chemotaxis protein
MQNANNITEALESYSQRELGDVKVLMVEDDTFLAQLVLAKLSTDGCIPYTTASGEEALELALQYMPDIIILDLMLPGMSGEEVLIQLKAHETLKTIPVIVFSNKSGDENVQLNLAHGASEYLVKSATDLNSLSAVVKRLAIKS